MSKKAVIRNILLADSAVIIKAMINDMKRMSSIKPKGNGGWFALDTQPMQPLQHTESPTIPAPQPPIRQLEHARGALNEIFIDGEGIHREVLQKEICKYLGRDAYSRPGIYNVCCVT